MKTRLARTVVVGAIAVAAALVPGGSALAAPADSAVITSATSSEGHFLVRWTLPATAYATKIEVSRDRAVGTTGEFFPENVVVSAGLDDNASDWTSDGRYPPGTYYVRGGCPGRRGIS
jgi:hypothetical protein